MTAQIEDTFILDGEHYALKIDLSEYIHPGTWGIEPTAMHTACWRGYYVTIMVREGRLLLNQLTVSARGNTYPTINGIQPEVKAGTALYADLNLQLPFTGRLIAARDFDRRHYQHMGFHPLSAYKTVVYLELEDGLVTGREDIEQDTSANPVDRPPRRTASGSPIIPRPPPPPPSADGASPEEQPAPGESAAEEDGVMDWIIKRFTRS